METKISYLTGPNKFIRAIKKYKYTATGKVRKKRSYLCCDVAKIFQNYVLITLMKIFNIAIKNLQFLQNIENHQNNLCEKNKIKFLQNRSNAHLGYRKFNTRKLKKFSVIQGLKI